MWYLNWFNATSVECFVSACHLAQLVTINDDTHKDASIYCALNIHTFTSSSSNSLMDTKQDQLDWSVVSYSQNLHIPPQYEESLGNNLFHFGSWDLVILMEC